MPKKDVGVFALCGGAQIKRITNTGTTPKYISGKNTSREKAMAYL
jgi:hypothetical protein